MGRKLFFIIMMFVSYSVCMTGQTEYYYYYRGEKIPLFTTDKKCVSIPKSARSINESLLSAENVLNQIADDRFEIFVVKETEVGRMKLSSYADRESESAVVSPCYVTKNNMELYLSPYLNVRLKKEEDIDVLTKYAKDYGLEIVKMDKLMPLWYVLAVTPESGKNALECANALWESGEFAASVPDLCSDNSLDESDIPNDPLFKDQWNLYNGKNAGIDISACAAWKYATGKNVKIAILDTGVDLNHKDLYKNISELSYDTETGTSPSVLYRDHATHCAGIAAAVKDNGIQVAGVAPDATVISISNSLKATSNSQLKRADGIIWAYQNGADIISNSWHSSEHDAIDEAIKEAFTYGRGGKGCVIVFASGNAGEMVTYPASCNEMNIVVGSVDNKGEKASNSCYGKGLDVVAPGVNILSTLPNNITGYKSGTSMACPHVAGIAALILERNPELTVNQVEGIICSNTKKLPDVDFSESETYGSWNTGYGYGLVDAYKSVINTPTVIYVQNEKVTGTREIYANNVYIGNDVTDRKDKGAVVIGPGDITIKAKFTEIKNSTFIPLGTTFKIKNDI